VSHRTMHSKIQYDIKMNMAIAKKHSGNKIALIRGGCYST